MEPLAAKIIYFVGYWLANFVIRAPYIKSHQRVPIRSKLKDRVDHALFLAVGVGGFLIPLLYVFTPLLSFADYSLPLWVGVTATVLLLAGDWLFWRAHKDLGTNWSPTLEIRDQHRLVTQGIYAHIRHPMYSSIWLLVLAQAMILPNYLAGFTGLIPFALLYFLRVGKEEQMMLAEFGAEYEQYLQRTGRLLPKF
ncbi:MAG: protein-S-isoprenylcysteine O-methyltransferase [Verrucomicrobiota bacterium]